ncbi:MAG: flagellar protein FlbD [Actinomycetota bacterium]|nr:flagellar protein FlbD [Actinomycetota bacterium]
MLTRLGGRPFALNPDLMEKAEATPDTVITMVDGHKFVVTEPVEDVVGLILLWRASVTAKAFELTSAPETDDSPCRDAGDRARVLQLPAREE